MPNSGTDMPDMGTWLEARVHFEDARYPTLILDGPWGTHGYDVDRETGDLRRVCICYARSGGECVCGAWDEREE